MLKRIIIMLIITNLFTFFPLKSEEISLNNWQIHTTMNNSICATTDIKDKIWVGSTGGVAVYRDENDDNPILLNVGNKLLSSTINTIISVNNNIIAGTSDGIIEVIDINSFECEHITSIKNYEGFASAGINDFYLLNDNKTLLVAGNFGMATFDIDKKIFMESILTIGHYSKNTPINNIILVDDTIYVSTPTGIAWTTLGKKLSIPSNWNTLLYGGTSNYSNAKIVNYEGNIFANLNNAIYRLNNNVFKSYIKHDSAAGIFFTDIKVYEGRLAVANDYQITIINDIEYPENSWVLVYNWDSKNNGFVVLNNSNLETKIIMLFQLFGSAFIKENYYGEVNEMKTPNTPLTNNFYGLSLDKDEILYAVSDNSQKNLTYGPFMSFDGNKWTNYHPKLSDFPTHTLFNSIAISPDNKIYCSSWGSGVFIKDKNTDNFIEYNDTNSDLRGVNPDGSYVVCGQTAFDSKGNAWVVNYGENAVGPMVVMFDKNENSYGFNNVVEQGGPRWVFNIAIDANDTKWICGFNGNSYGLYYFNERNTIADKSDDIWGNITTSKYSDLLSNYFHSCIYDKYTGTIWLGSNAGIAVINNPNSALNKTPGFILRKNKLLEGQHINDIFIDATGNKWISTKNGLWVVSVGGDELLAHFTTANTPLISNEVQTVTINSNNGLVYIGTTNGLFIAQGNILMPQNDYAIKTFPQPYNLQKHKEVIIDGLTSESNVRIVTADGVLIRRLITSSKRAVWDGKDDNGSIVKPGIYLVLSNSQISNSGGAAKIVVVDY